MARRKKAQRGKARSEKAEAKRVQRTDETPSGPDRMPTWLGALILLILCFVAYGPALNAGFIWDDEQYVEHNPTLGHVGGLVDIWFDVSATPQYYPLVHTSFWIEDALWGREPAVYHRTNVLLHALSALMLWRVLALLGLPAAWLAAALFALHPVQVESVAWITERKNVLSGLFYFAAAWVYLRHYLGINSETEHSKASRRGAYGLAFLLFTAALFSKTVTASWPAAMLLVLWWRQGRLRIADVRPLVPFFVLGVGLGLFTAWVEKFYVGAAGAAWSLAPIERILVAGRALWFYAGKLLWPHPLIFIYPRWTIDAGAAWQYLFPLGVAAVVVALFFLRKRLGLGPLVAVLFFAGTLFPALGFVDVYPMQYSFVADHFQYLATPGLLVLLAVGLESLRRRLRSPWGWLPAALVVVVLTGLTWQRTAAYKDLETLWRDTLARNPDAWMAHNNLGLLIQDRGELDAALGHFRRTVELAPDYAYGHNNLGTVLFELGRSREALSHFERAIELDGEYARAVYNLASAYEAVGRVASAETTYRRSLSLDPTHAKAHNNLGGLLAKEGRFGEAIFHFQESLALRPEAETTRFNLASALAAVGRQEEALGHFLTLAEERPEWAIPRLRAAWILATASTTPPRDPSRALALLDGVSTSADIPPAVLLDHQAAALAAVGRFEEAITAAETALRGVRGRQASEIFRRLEEYRASRALFLDS